MTTEFQSWLGDHLFTPSELDAYQLCPFRFYAQAYLKLTPEVRRDVELTPPEIGSLVHRVLERVLRVGAIHELPLQILDEELKKFRKDRPHLSQVLAEFQRKRIVRTLENFIDDLKEERATSSGFRPKFFEWSFGRETPPLEIADGRGGAIRIRGRIDRIDVDEARKQFLVIDYKTGSTKITGNQIKSGEALQLPLYILAVQSLLLPDYEPIGAVYHQLSDLSKKDGLLHAERIPSFLDLHPRSSSIVPAAQWEPVMEKILDGVRDIVGKIRDEAFASHENACETYCPFQDICRLRNLQQTPAGANE